MTVAKFTKLQTKYDAHVTKISTKREHYEEFKSSEANSFTHFWKAFGLYISYLWTKTTLSISNNRYLHQVEKKKRFALTMVGEVWWKKALSKAMQWIFLAVFLFIMIYPFYWMLTTSFKPFSDVQPTAKDTFWPKHWSTEAYKSLFTYVKHMNDGTDQTYHVSVGLFFGNSIWIALCSTAAEMVVSLLGGFAIYNWKTKLNKIFMGFMFALIMIPGESLLLGRFIFAVKLGWKDSAAALIVPFIGNTYTVYLFSNAFSSMNPALKKAAKIDGLSSFKFFWKIAIPAIKSTIVTSVIVSFISAWNSTLWPVMIMDGGSKHATIPMLLYGMMSIVGADISQDLAGLQNPYNLKMAASVISILPILAIFIVFNRPIIKGLSSRSTKGTKA